MKNFFLSSMNSPFYFMLCCCIILSSKGNPVQITNSSKFEDSSTNLSHYNAKNVNSTLNCKTIEYSLKDVMFLKNNDSFIKAKKIVIPSSKYQNIGGKILTCLTPELVSKKEVVLNCTEKFNYESHEFEILPNTSALVHGVLVTPEEYALKGKELLTCASDDEDYDEPPTINLDQISISIGKIGSSISIVALLMHLLTFFFIPSLRNLPGYNLASLSTAFLLAYSFILIGQIPEVLNLSCIISAVLQQNFFLVAFFCMNVLAFDVWKTLKQATEKFAVRSQNTRKRQFIWYSLYAWGCPLVISTISVIVDNVDGIPNNIKPNYGKGDICWITNNLAKTIFFAAPSFTLVIINGFFFISSSWIISSNTMKCTKDQTSQTVRLNYALYARLALMMGMTWLVGIIALISKNKIIWIVFDLLNSLQGLFLFLLFTCTRKVFKHLVETVSLKNSISIKQTTLSSNSNASASKF